VTWRVGTVTALRDETPTARTLVLDVADWPGHVAGQHVDVRLTAADGYSATRSYSLASAAGGGPVELTVEQLPDGEVSPYLAHEVSIGDEVEVRGPVGGWFVWRPEQPEPVQLVAGGSGLVPLMSMLRTHCESGSEAPMRLLYSVRDAEAVLYHGELDRRAHRDPGVDITYVYTRTAPRGRPRAPGRIDAGVLAETTWPPGREPTCYVCGPTAFVETVATLLVAAGHDAGRIRTERFGPSGGR
jgi:ferredoxin-NADP reductase